MTPGQWLRQRDSGKLFQVTHAGRLGFILRRGEDFSGYGWSAEARFEPVEAPARLTVRAPLLPALLAL